MKRYERKFSERQIMLIKLIDGNSKLVNKQGYISNGGEIIDKEGNKYIAGYDKKGQIHVLNVDELNYVLDFNWKRTKYKI